MGKYFLQISYVILGVFLVYFYPRNCLIADLREMKLSSFKKEQFFVGIFLLIFIASLILLPIQFVAWSIVFSFILNYFFKYLDQSKYLASHVVAIFIGYVMGSFLSSWSYNDHNRLSLSIAQSLQVISISGISYLFLILPVHPLKPIILDKLLRALCYCIAAIFICYLSLSVGQNLKIDSFYQWHHWGAYIAQAELLFNGVLPFNDIPLLYGLGPVSVIAIGCYWNCWLGMFWIASISPIVLTTLIIYLSLKLSRCNHALGILIVLVISILTCLVWPPYQLGILSIFTFPSISALRFLPALILFCITLSIALGLKKSIHPIDFKTLVAHVCWILCFAWSPEAAIQSSIVWMPFFTWHRHPKPSIILLIKSIVELLLILFFGLSILCVIFYIFFGAWPDLTQFLIYFRFQQAEYEKVNSNGMIWFFIACTLLFLSLIKSKEGLAIPKNNLIAIWLTALLCFANFSYYLSHSHDSVLADLLPYLSLLLFSIYGQLGLGFRKIVCAILLSSLIGWASLLMGWDKVMQNIQSEIHGSITYFLVDAPNQLIRRFDREIEDPFSVNPRSQDETYKSKTVNRAIAYIHNNYHESVETFDKWWLVDAGEVYPPWNTLHGPVNFWRLPSEMRRQYLASGAKKLRRSGWLLYDKSLPSIDLILKDYDEVYIRVNELDFDGYKAIRYQPK